MAIIGTALLIASGVGAASLTLTGGVTVAVDASGVAAAGATSLAGAGAIYSAGKGNSGKGRSSSYLSNQKANQIKNEILEGDDVQFKTKEEAVEFIEKKFPDFKQEAAGSRRSEGWYFDSHPINGSAGDIEHINIYSKQQGFRVILHGGNKISCRRLL